MSENAPLLSGRSQNSTPVQQEHGPGDDNDIQEEPGHQHHREEDADGEEDIEAGASPAEHREGEEYTPAPSALSRFQEAAESLTAYLVGGAPASPTTAEEEGITEEPAGEKKKKKDKKKKRAKEEQGDDGPANYGTLAPPVYRPAKGDDLKTHMANERTFFKWLFTGFHIGAMGTFILTFYAEDSGGNGVAKILLCLFIWVVALVYIMYGLINFYRRRRALRQGLSKEEWDSGAGPAYVVAGLVVVIGSVLMYSLVTGESPHKWQQP